MEGGGEGEGGMEGRGRERLRDLLSIHLHIIIACNILYWKCINGTHCISLIPRPLWIGLGMRLCTM